MKIKKPFATPELVIVRIAADLLISSSDIPEDDGGFGELHFFN